VPTPPPLPPRPTENASTPVAADVYAPFGRRAVAFIIDYILLACAVGVAAALLVPKENNGDTQWLPVIVICAIVLFYKAGLESSKWQATLGKLALGIKVTSQVGERIGFMHASGRLVCQLLNSLTLNIGYFVAAFTKRRQALHDIIAGTLVVRARCSPAEIALAPPARPGDGAAIVIVVVLGGVVLVGILAAIAIPAYQNYIIRVQISEGLGLATAFETEVKEFYETTGTFPVSASATGSDTTILMPHASSGKYVSDITVDRNGNIAITYNGPLANPKIRGLVLYLQPGTDAQGDVAWICGTANIPSGVTLSRAATTTVPAQYLPSSCHP